MFTLHFFRLWTKSGVEELYARICLLQNHVLKKSLAIINSSDTCCELRGAPEIRGSMSAIIVTGLSTSSHFPLSQMDHQDDVFMEAISASGPEHIQAIHAFLFKESPFMKSVAQAVCRLKTCPSVQCFQFRCSSALYHKQTPDNKSFFQCLDEH